MSFDALRGMVLDLSFGAFGVAATVTPLNSAPVDTTAIWLTPNAEDMPATGDLQRREMRRVVALSRADVPSLPRGSQLLGAEREGGTVRTWRVDSIDFADPDHHRAVVVLDE